MKAVKKIIYVRRKHDLSHFREILRFGELMDNKTSRLCIYFTYLLQKMHEMFNTKETSSTITSAQLSFLLVHLFGNKMNLMVI